MSQLKLNHYINGAYAAPLKNQYLDNVNPANGEIYSQVASGTSEDVEEAYKAAAKALPSWTTTPAEDKFKVLNRIAELIDESNERFAEAESIDQGKPVWLAKNEIKRAAQNFRFFATGQMHFASESHAMEKGTINYTLRKPLGVVACISPWNLPLYLFSWKIAPAIAAGNCVIAKPSEFTPYTANLLGEICTKAGLPAGVLNIVQGLGQNVGEALVTHENIKAISFTGGTTTGKRIASIAAPMFKKLSLELGGKNPNILFDDCDLDKAIETSIKSSFLNQGEICLCGSRILVQKGIYERFKAGFIEKVNALNVGPPKNKDSFLGAIVSEPHYKKILDYIELAKEEGGQILAGGMSIHPKGHEKGFYIAPTVIEGLKAEARCNLEEIFGPVVSIMPFETEEEALAIANAVDYGLACTIWTNHLERAHRMANKIQTGIVWINCWLLRDLRTPFGGTKSSGVGREGGWEALKFFTEPKNVCIQVNLNGR